jgi:hypothetical protein
MTWHVQIARTAYPVECQVEFYVGATYSDAVYLTATSTWFDDNGVGLNYGMYTYMETTGLFTNSFVSSSTFGSTNVPNWCPEPSASGNSYRQGYRVGIDPLNYGTDATLAVVRWNFTFK